MVINKAIITSNIAGVEERPFFSNHASEGRQIMAINIERNKGFKMGAAAFMPAIMIIMAASEIRIELCLLSIFISLTCRVAVDYINLVSRVRLTYPTR